MSDEPDPQTVRELTRKATQLALHQGRDVHVNAALFDYWVSSGETFLAFRTAVLAEYDRLAAALAGPAEQPQDAQPGRDNPAPDLWWSFTGGADTCYLNHDDSGSYRECCMRAGLAYALEVRDQQVRTEAQPERDGDDDVRAVAAALQAWAVGDNAKLGSALMALREVFIGRIAEVAVRDRHAELDARDAKAGK